MTDKDNGGPAFPACNEANVNDTMGMFLRDWYAGMALQGLISNSSPKLQPNLFNHEAGKLVSAQIAEKCFLYADAMIEARKK